MLKVALQGWLMLAALLIVAKITLTLLFGYHDCGYGEYNFFVCY